MIKEVDVDGDGRIDFYEFAHALGEPENSEDCDDDDDDDKTLPRTPSPTSDKTPVVTTVITSPIDTPKQKDAPQQLDFPQVEHITGRDIFDDPVPGPSKDTNTVSKLVNSTPFKEHTIRKPSPEPRASPRPTARQSHSPKPSSRPTSRSVSPDPNSSRSLSNSVYERARSPSLKDQGASNLLGYQDRSRRTSRVSLVSEEVALISKASFRESYNAMVKPKQKSNPDSPTSEFTLNLSELRAMAGLADAAKKASNQYKLSNPNDHDFSDSPEKRNSKLSDLTFLRESFDIGDNDEFEMEESETDSALLTYKPVPGFGESAFYLSKEILYQTVDSNESTTSKT